MPDMPKHLGVRVRNSIRDEDFIGWEREPVLKAELVESTGLRWIELVDFVRIGRVYVIYVVTTLLIPATFSFFKISVSFC